MKCGACNYKYEEYDYDLKDTTSDGEEEFINIEGVFTVMDGYYHNNVKKVNLYSCLRCNTVQMSKW